MKWRFLLFPFILTLMASEIPESDHAIYISVVEINCNSTTIKLKVFSDDLRDVLRNFSDQYKRVPLSELVESNKLLVEGYFSEKLELTINEEKAPIELVGAREEGDAYFLFFSISTRTDWKSMSLKGDYFSEIFPDQSNVFTVECGGEKKFARLTKSRPLGSFIFD